MVCKSRYDKPLKAVRATTKKRVKYVKKPTRRNQSVWSTLNRGEY